MNEEINKTKKGFGKGLLTGVLITIGVFILVAVIAAVVLMKYFPQATMYINTVPKEEDKVSNDDNLNMGRIEAKLNAMQEVVKKKYLFDQDIDEAEEGIYKGYVQGLGDKYSVYYSADEFEDLQASMEGVFYGIGAVVQQDPDTKVVSVVRVLEDSPAQKAGVQNGDIIYEVDGELASDMDLDTLVYQKIRGEKGTDVTITFYRDGKKIDITITRGEVPQDTVYSEVKDDDIGYIEVTSFTDETVEQFIKAVEEVQKDGAKSLVIDLRDNGGGVLTASVEMIDYLIPDGVEEHDGLIVYTANKNGIGERYYAKDNHQVDIPIVLLVNGNSASASEVFTGAMMDYDAATVIGSQTFGKGIVQQIMPMGDGSAIKLTTEHYYTPDGTDLHGEGLTPDEVLELNDECKMYTDENDNQYQKAVEILHKGK